MKRSPSTRFLAALIPGILATVVWAPQIALAADPPDPLTARVDALERLVAEQAKEIQRLNARLAAQAPAPAQVPEPAPAPEPALSSAAPSESDFYQGKIAEGFYLHGYFNFEYERQLDALGKGDREGSFDMDNFDLILDVRPAERTRVAADLTWEHGAGTEDGRGNVAVEYAFAEYAARDWFKVRAGKFVTPYGIYNEIHVAKPAYLSVKEPWSIDRPDKLGGTPFFPRWMSGVQALGNGSMGPVDFDYVLGIGNGEQEYENPFEKDDNTAKAFVGRFRLYPSNHWEWGLSFYHDRLTERDPAGEDTGNRTKFGSWGSHLKFNYGGFGAELEYARAKESPSHVASRTHYGISAMVFYSFKDRFTPYLRYEYLDPDTKIDRDWGRQVVAGLNTRFNGHFILKSEFGFVRGGENNLRLVPGKNDFTELRLGLVAAF